MSKKEKEKKQPFIKTKTRNDGSTEVIITKAPQKTLWGRIIICVLAALMGLGAVASLIFVLMQA